MNNLNMRNNKARFNDVVLGQIKNGFERALLWQNEQLDEHSSVKLSYAAQEKCDQTIAIFLSMVCTHNKATDQVFNHGLTQTGHDLALQMLGHGVGFWEQHESDYLSVILDFLLDMKSIKPFELYYCEDNNFLDWNGV